MRGKEGRGVGGWWEKVGWGGVEVVGEKLMVGGGGRVRMEKNIGGGGGMGGGGMVGGGELCGEDGVVEVGRGVGWVTVGVLGLGMRGGGGRRGGRGGRLGM